MIAGLWRDLSEPAVENLSISWGMCTAGKATLSGPVASNNPTAWIDLWLCSCYFFVHEATSQYQSNSAQLDTQRPSHSRGANVCDRNSIVDRRIFAWIFD